MAKRGGQLDRWMHGILDMGRSQEARYLHIRETSSREAKDNKETETETESGWLYKAPSRNRDGALSQQSLDVWVLLLLP